MTVACPRVLDGSRVRPGGFGSPGDHLGDKPGDSGEIATELGFGLNGHRRRSLLCCVPVGLPDGDGAPGPGPLARSVTEYIEAEPVAQRRELVTGSPKEDLAGEMADILISFRAGMCRTPAAKNRARQ